MLPAAVQDFFAAGDLEYVASCALPTTWATFELHAFLEHRSGKEHLALTLGEIGDGEPVLARIHSECLTGDALFSQRCDCGAQLETALQRIAREGRGIVLYLRQEGRGIGLINKIRAYQLRQAGADTVDANHRLGFAADLRDYSVCKPLLDHLKVGSVRLMTNNPRKIEALQRLNMQVAERVALVAGRNRFNQRYLDAKSARLGHWISVSGTQRQAGAARGLGETAP